MDDLGGIATGIGGGLLGLIGQQQQNSFNSAQASNQMDFQREMSNTAHQREVTDLTKAGLNPILSGTGGSGSSTPSGAMAAASSNPAEAAMNSAQTALNSKKTLVDIQNASKSGDLLISQKNAADTQALLNTSSAAKNAADTTYTSGPQTGKTNAETNLTSKEAKIIGPAAQVMGGVNSALSAIKQSTDKPISQWDVFKPGPQNSTINNMYKNRGH